MTHNIRPEGICAVTFTNKAANEMKDRLSKLIGPERTKKLKLGTFHAICVRFLRIYFKDVGLDSNFTVCDADDRYFEVSWLTMRSYILTFDPARSS